MIAPRRADESPDETGPLTEAVEAARQAWVKETDERIARLGQWAARSPEPPSPAESPEAADRSRRPRRRRATVTEVPARGEAPPPRRGRSPA